MGGYKHNGGYNINGAVFVKNGFKNFMRRNLTLIFIIIFSSNPQFVFLTQVFKM